MALHLFVGLNNTGPEKGTPGSGTYGVDWRYDTQATLDYLAGLGTKVVRIMFRWERIQPTLGAALDATELQRVKDYVTRATTAGMLVVLAVNKGARYNEIALGDVGGPTQANFADLWSRLAAEFKDNAAVLAYGNNEPHDLPDSYSSFTNVATFDVDTEGWISESGSGVTVARSTTTVHDGPGSLQATKTVASGSFQSLRVTDNVTTTHDESSGGYDYACWVFCPAGETGWFAQIDITDSAGANIAGSPVALTANAWTYVVGTFTTAQVAAMQRKIVQIHNASPTAGSKTFNVDSIVHAVRYTGLQRWQDADRAAVAAVRAAGDQKVWLAAGYGWAAAAGWTARNGAPWHTTHNVVYEAHLYYDNDHSGTYPSSYAAETTNATGQGYASVTARALAWLNDYLGWLASYGVPGLLGETGWPDTDSGAWNAVGNTVLSAVMSARVPALIWAVGEIEGTGYPLTPWEASGGVGTTVNTANVQATTVAPYFTYTAAPVTRALLASGYDSAGTSPLTFTVPVPTGIFAGDFGYLLVSWVGVVGDPTTVAAASGTGNTWTTLVGPRSDNNMGWALLARRVGATDAAAVTVTLGAVRQVTAGAYWYSDVDATGVVGAVGSRGGVTGSTTTAPSITAGGAGRTVLAIFAERTTTAGTTATLNVGTIRLFREGASGSTASVLLADLTGTGATTGAVVATYSAASGNGAGVQVELIPVVTSPPGDASAPGFAGGFTGGLGPEVVVIPPGPPGPPLPSPVPSGTAGAPAPARWIWAVGSWRTGPDTVLSKIRNRRVTWRRTGRHEASFELDGRDPDSATIQTMVDDLWVIRSAATGLGRTLFRGRCGITGDAGDADAQSATFAAAEYRAVLDRRWLWDSGPLTFTTQDQSGMAWAVLSHTQAQTNGPLGIIKGVGQATGVVRPTMTYPGGKAIGEILDELAAMDNGFDWQLTPAANPRDRTLYFDVFYPTMGVDRGTVLDYGGRVVAFTRQVDPGQYANTIRGTGADSTATGGTLLPVRLEASDLVSRPEGRWDGTMTATDQSSQQAITDLTTRALAAAQVITPAWTVTLAPNGWAGPDDVWLGDPVTLVVRSGRLNVVESLQVQEISCSWDDNDTVTTTLALGAIERPGKRWSLRRVDQRLRALERR